MSSSWQVVAPKKRVKQKHVKKEKAMQLQRDMDIEGLAEVVMSIESKNLQEDGWKFEGVTKGDIQGNSFFGLNGVAKNFSDLLVYTTLPISNKWLDRAVFSRSK